MTTQQILKDIGLQNPHGLTKDHIHAIAQHFGRLRELDEKTAARTVRYVIDGTDEEVLLTLGGMKDAVTVLFLTPRSQAGNYGNFQAAAKERSILFRPGTEVAPGLWIRIANVLDAARRAAGAPVQPPPDWPSWLATLMHYIMTAWRADERRGAQRPGWTLSELEAMLEIASLPTGLIARAFLDPESLRAMQTGGYYYGSDTDIFLGWDRYLARHLDAVREALGRTEAGQRLHVPRHYGTGGIRLHAGRRPAGAARRRPRQDGAREGAAAAGAMPQAGPAPHWPRA